ncbi:MAG: FHA domain-containing protein [Kofleriaceae bacterium]|nr:FHA domain-containing protein [Kofleriaceae bacterium]
MFSSALREAEQAEAAGNMDLAAERYALAGNRDGAVRMHMARAARAADRTGELAALRDAVRWAGDDVELRATAAAALGRALWAAAKAEGIATERDRVRVREAAELMVQGREWSRAGEALESIGDFAGAAHAYSAGGLVEKLERAIGLDDQESLRERTEKNALASYQTNLEIGQRDQACADLREAIANSEHPQPHRRLLQELETKLLTGGRLVLRSGPRTAFVVCGSARVVFGRDPLCDVVLGAGGVSRQHGEIRTTRVAGATTFTVADLESRNGSRLAGLPLLATAEMPSQGLVDFGDEAQFEFARQGDLMGLRCIKGRDRGLVVVVATADSPVVLTAWGLALQIDFRNGRPWLTGLPTSERIVFGDQPLGPISVQLIRTDTFTIGATVFEVE